MAKKKRRKKYKIDPITGFRYEKGSLWDQLDQFERQTFKPISKRKPTYSRGRQREEIDPLAGAIVAIVIGFALFYVFVLQPMINWFQQNWIYVVLTLMTFLGVLFILWYMFIREPGLTEEEKKKLEEEEKIEKSIIRKRLLRERANELEGLSEKEKEYQLNKWIEEESNKKVVGKIPSLHTRTEFDSLLDTIRNSFKPEQCRDEEDLEKQLLQFLKAREYRVRRQVRTRKGTIDLVINEKYGIELKILDNKGKMIYLLGQAQLYKESFDKFAVILLDIKKISSPDLEDFISRYENLGIKTIVLEGTLKRKGKKSVIQINIRR